MKTTNDVALVGAELEAALLLGKLTINDALRYAAARAELAWTVDADLEVSPASCDATVRPGKAA